MSFLHDSGSANTSALPDSGASRPLAPKARRASGRIDSWNAEKGYGFVRTWGDRVFLHIRDFSEHHKRPEVGDRIAFFLGVDHRGRRCATGARHVNDGGRITLANIAFAALLLILPIMALSQGPFDKRLLAAYFAAINAWAYAIYIFDKHHARSKGWRISERQMHVMEALGGWPAAFLAQRQFRHKSSKKTYQAVFWLIVALYQWVAFDSINQWRYSRAAWAGIRELFLSLSTS